MGSWSEHLGEWMETTALLWLINELTHSPLMGTLMVTFRTLPMVFFALVGGIVSDRVNRRLVLKCALAASAVLSVGLAIVVHFDLVTPWLLLTYAALTGIATSFNHPARSTMLPNLVKPEHLLNAITMDNVSVTASRIAGASLAGVIISFAGTTPVLGLRAAGALLAMVWVFQIHDRKGPPRANRATPWQNFSEGTRYVWQHKEVLTQVLLFLVPIYINNSYTGLLPYFANDVLHVGPGLYGLMSSGAGIGSIMVVLILANVRSFEKIKQLLYVGGTVQGLALITLCFASNFAVALLILVFIGAASTTFMAVNNTIIQTLVTDQLRGRVMSFREVAFGLGPSGSLVSGAIAGVIGVPYAFVVAGVIPLIVLGIIRLTVKPRLKPAHVEEKTGSPTQ